MTDRELLEENNKMLKEILRKLEYKERKRSRVSKNWSSSIYVKRYRHRF